MKCYALVQLGRMCAVPSVLLLALITLLACQPIQPAPSSSVPLSTAEESSAESVALWPEGDVALWPEGDVALWPEQDVALWPEGDVALWPEQDLVLLPVEAVRDVELPTNTLVLAPAWTLSDTRDLSDVVAIFLASYLPKVPANAFVIVPRNSPGLAMTGTLDLRSGLPLTVTADAPLLLRSKSTSITHEQTRIELVPIDRFVVTPNIVITLGGSTANSNIVDN